MARRADVPGTIGGATTPADAVWTQMPTTLPCLLFRLAHDGDRGVLFLSDWFEELTGESAAPYRDGARRFMDRIHPDDRRRLRKHLDAAAVAAQNYSVEYRLLHSAGHDLWVVENGRPVFEGGQTVFDGVIVDLTVRQRAIEQQQGIILAISSDPAVIAGDTETALTRISEAAARATGIDRVGIWLFDGAVAGGQMVLQTLYTADDDRHESGARLDAREYPAYFHALMHRRTIAAHDAPSDPITRELEAAYLQPHGIGAILDASIRLHGEVAGVVCFEHVGGARTWEAHEIHFAGEVADQVAHVLLHEDRHQVVNERETLRDQLFQAQKLDAVGRLAGGIAHDFNNMLTVIGGAAELLEMDMEEGDEPVERRQLVEDIAQTSRRAAELTRQLLTFSRRHPSEMMSVSINVLVRDMQRLMQRLLGADMELVLSLQKGVPPILANVNQFEQVLTNLLVNARDAMPEGGQVVLATRALSVERPEKCLTGIVATGVYGVISMSDEGCGMTPETVAEIFEPFFTTKANSGGTGLGLSTVYGIVRQWHGHIRVETEVGVGTTFEILIPATATSPAADAAVAEERGPARGGSETILLVEDEPMVRRFATQVLEHLGYTVRTAGDGREAIEHLEAAHDVEMVVSDMIMPEIGGVALGKWLAVHRPGMPLLFITGYSDTDTPTSEIFPHAGVLDKPFTTSSLAQAVRRVLDAAAKR